MAEQTEHFSNDEPRRDENGRGRVACPICGALVDLADTAEVSRHLNGLHGTPSGGISF